MKPTTLIQASELKQVNICRIRSVDVPIANMNWHTFSGFVVEILLANWELDITSDNLEVDLYAKDRLVAKGVYADVLGTSKSLFSGNTLLAYIHVEEPSVSELLDTIVDDLNEPIQ